MNFLMGLPKAVLATLMLSVGILLIVLLNPPHGLCDSQKSWFEKKVENLLFVSTEDRQARGDRAISKINKAKKLCESQNKTGGCYDYFSQIKFFINEFETVSRECRPKVFQINEVKRVVSGAIQLMSKIAWGKEPPRHKKFKLGRLGESNRALFCRVKKIIKTHDIDSWRQVFQILLKTLPGATELGEKKAWPLMLGSIVCYN